MEILTSERSQLYSLELIDENNVLKESLSSYICRLAEAHHVTVGTLIGKIFTPKLNKKYLNNTAKNGGGGLYKSTSSLNGIGSLSEELAEVLDELTLRNDIKQLTLVKWQEVLTVRGLLRATKAWCPHCIEEMGSTKGSIYEPLIWSFQAIDFCFKHKVVLSLHCPGCKQSIPVLHRRSRNGYCPKCGQWLGIERKETVIINDWDEWKWLNIGELIRDSNHSEIQRQSIKKYLQYIVTKYFNGKIKAFSKKMNIPNTTFKCWLNGDTIPPIIHLINISFCTKVPLIKILTGQSYDKELKNHFSPFQKKVSNTNTLKTKSFNPSTAKYEIEHYLDSIDKPISVSKLSSDLGYDRRLLYIHFPHLCYRVAKDYLDYINALSKERIESVSNELREKIDFLTDMRVYPSRRKIEKFTSKGLLKEKSMKKIWKDKLKQYPYHY